MLCTNVILYKSQIAPSQTISSILGSNRLCVCKSNKCLTTDSITGEWCIQHLFCRSNRYYTYYRGLKMVKLRIDKILEEKSKTRYWLKKQLGGMDYRNLNALVNNDVNRVRLDTLDRLRIALDCSIGDLFEVADDNTSTNSNS